MLALIANRQLRFGTAVGDCMRLTTLADIKKAINGSSVKC